MMPRFCAVLWALLKDWCVEKKIYTIRLRTQLKRLEAQRFYKALLFEEIKEQKVFQLNIQK